MSSQVKISDTHLDQKFFQPPKMGVLQWYGHTDRQTDGHRDSMTESVQWTDSEEIQTDYNNKRTFCIALLLSFYG